MRSCTEYVDSPACQTLREIDRSGNILQLGFTHFMYLAGIDTYLLFIKSGYLKKYLIHVMTNV
jgi:hypothetical protein